MNKNDLRRFVGFSLCNAPGTVVELSVVWLAARYIFDSYFGEYVVAPIIAFECAVVTNFMLFSHFVWRDRTRGLHIKGRLLRLLGYNLSATGVYLLRIGLIQVMGLSFQWHVVVCDLLSMSFSGILNYFINDRLIFARNRKHKILISLLITVAYPWVHLRVRGREHVRAKGQPPVVYVCNHGFLSGPVMASVNLPDTFRPWVDNRVLDRKECYDNLYETFGRGLRVGERIRHFMLRAMRKITISIVNDFNPIPVVKDGTRQIVQTLECSMETLLQGTSLLIFPEHPRQAFHGDVVAERMKAESELRSFYSGFGFIGELYRRRTGRVLSFVPVYVDRKHRILHVAEGIDYPATGNSRNDRQDLSDRLYQSISQLAENAVSSR